MSNRGVVTLDLDAAPLSPVWGSPERWIRAVVETCKTKNSPNATFVRWIADQIEAQTKPPRIPEPGLWGVVRAGDSTVVPRALFVRTPTGWYSDDRLSPRAWDDLVDPELVREGVDA